MKRIFQSTSPVWRTTVQCFQRLAEGVISIHVPRVEDDGTCGTGKTYAALISIHVPRVEDDNIMDLNFLMMKYFNPRPPCGGRRASSAVCAQTL